MDLGDAPGYGAFLTQSDGSRRKQNFIVGSGQKVPNEGQLVLNLESDGGENRKIKSTFQVAEAVSYHPLTPPTVFMQQFSQTRLCGHAL